MFDLLTMAPPDAILGLTEAYKKDPNPEKINLGVGVYKDARGATPILQCVKEAERRILAEENTKSYFGIPGPAEFGQLTRALLFGADHEIVTGDRAVTAQTPGGTGGLRVAADFIKTVLPTDTIWMSSPTWANHPKIFAAAGLRTESYPYYDPANHALDIDGMIQTLEQVPRGDVVLLHACCHNPSGMDPTPEEWKRIAAALAERELLPLVDFAYQGFAAGLEEDAGGLLDLCATGRDVLIAGSFSKNFGLYRERVGALTAVTGSAETAQVVMSQMKGCIRANYSNPPAHGGLIVSNVLADPELRGQWEAEVTVMRDRVNSMRSLFVETMKDKGVKQNYSFLTEQRGMFSFSGLNPMQVDRLRNEFSIYIVGSGRINVAGITTNNVERLCDAIAQVL